MIYNNKYIRNNKSLLTFCDFEKRSVKNVVIKYSTLVHDSLEMISIEILKYINFKCITMNNSKNILKIITRIGNYGNII